MRGLKHPFASPHAIGQARRKQQSVQEISDQIVSMFKDPDSAVTEIPVANDRQIVATLSSILSKFKLADWDMKLDLIIKIMGLVKGGAVNFISFIQQVEKLEPLISDCILSLRSALVKYSCLLVAQLSQKLCESFANPALALLPTLFRPTQNGIQIIADSCRFAILSIARHCQSKKIMQAIFEFHTSKSGVHRTLVAHCVFLIVSNWEREYIIGSFRSFEKVLLSLLSDPSPDARQFARDSVRKLQEITPQKCQRIYDQLDTRTRTSIDGPISAAVTIKASRRAASVGNENRQNPVRQSAGTPKAQRPPALFQDEKPSFQKGQERKYLSYVKQLVLQGESHEIIEKTDEITESILMGMTDAHQEIVVLAMTILDGVISIIPDAFVVHLREILQTLFEQSLKESAGTKMIAEKLIKTVGDLYPTDELLDAALTCTSSWPMFAFADRVLRMKKVKLNERVMDRTIKLCATIAFDEEVEEAEEKVKQVTDLLLFLKNKSPKRFVKVLTTLDKHMTRSLRKLGIIEGRRVRVVEIDSDSYSYSEEESSSSEAVPNIELGRTQTIVTDFEEEEEEEEEDVPDTQPRIVCKKVIGELVTRHLLDIPPEPQLIWDLENAPSTIVTIKPTRQNRKPSQLSPIAVFDSTFNSKQKPEKARKKSRSMKRRGRVFVSSDFDTVSVSPTLHLRREFLAQTQVPVSRVESESTTTVGEESQDSKGANERFTTPRNKANLTLETSSVSSSADKSVTTPMKTFEESRQAGDVLLSPSGEDSKNKEGSLGRGKSGRRRKQKESKESDQSDISTEHDDKTGTSMRIEEVFESPVKDVNESPQRPARRPLKRKGAPESKPQNENQIKKQEDESSKQEKDKEEIEEAKDQEAKDVQPIPSNQETTNENVGEPVRNEESVNAEKLETENTPANENTEAPAKAEVENEQFIEKVEEPKCGKPEKTSEANPNLEETREDTVTGKPLEEKEKKDDQQKVEKEEKATEEKKASPKSETETPKKTETKPKKSPRKPTPKRKNRESPTETTPKKRSDKKKWVVRRKHDHKKHKEPDSPEKEIDEKDGDEKTSPNNGATSPVKTTEQTKRKTKRSPTKRADKENKKSKEELQKESEDGKGSPRSNETPTKAPAKKREQTKSKSKQSQEKIDKEEKDGDKKEKNNETNKESTKELPKKKEDNTEIKKSPQKQEKSEKESEKKEEKTGDGKAKAKSERTKTPDEEKELKKESKTKKEKDAPPNKESKIEKVEDTKTEPGQKAAKVPAKKKEKAKQDEKTEKESKKKEEKAEKTSPKSNKSPTKETDQTNQEEKKSQKHAKSEKETHKKEEKAESPDAKVSGTEEKKSTKTPVKKNESDKKQSQQKHDKSKKEEKVDDRKTKSETMTEKPSDEQKSKKSPEKKIEQEDKPSPKETSPKKLDNKSEQKPNASPNSTQSKPKKTKEGKPKVQSPRRQTRAPSATNKSTKVLTTEKVAETPAPVESEDEKFLNKVRSKIAEIQTPAMEQLVRILLTVDNKAPTLTQIGDLIREEGGRGIRFVLPHLIRLTRSRFSTQANNVLRVVSNYVDSSQLLDMAIELISEPDPCQFVEFLTKTVASAKKIDLAPRVRQIMDVITPLLQHSTAEVRKRSVLCIVEMRCVMGAGFEAEIRKLKSVPRKLVTHYYQKRLSEQ